MVILLAQLVPGPEQTLRLDRHAGDGNVVQASHGEERCGKDVPASAEGGLACVTGWTQFERMDVDPAPPGRLQFDAVGAPVGLHSVTPSSERSEDSRLERRIDVDVDVPVGAGLSSYESVDTPAAFEPEPAPNRAKQGSHAQDLLQPGLGSLHSTIVPTRLGGMGASCAVPSPGHSAGHERTVVRQGWQVTTFLHSWTGLVRCAGQPARAVLSSKATDLVMLWSGSVSMR
jgi:hypothetical protein